MHSLIICKMFWLPRERKSFVKLEDPEYTMEELFCCSFNLWCILVKTLLYTGDSHPGGGGYSL